ncbi:MAG: alanine racemase [Candidatus Amulumruptor sp.]|nr:alanine racemase [Candidatus Amulumruptor sp.]
MPSALDFLNRRRTSARAVTVILSDLVRDARELSPSALYAEAADLLRRFNIDRVVGVGKEIAANAAAFASWGGNAAFYPTVDAFIADAAPDSFQSQLILVKGAPTFHFDHIADHLEARQHETVLEVNLDAVADNFNWFRSKLKPSTGIVCMIKASGYGAGAVEIAKTLQTRGAAYVAVAVVDEGVQLRNAGITMPIMVMNPKVANYRTMFAHRLEPEVYSFDLLADILDSARRCGEHDFPIHIKLDTGMHRLGFRIEDLDRLAAVLLAPENVGLLRPASVFSHLSVADCPDEDAYTRMQFDYFEEASGRLRSLLPDYDIKRHILNSTGIVRFPEHQYDMVRLGIGLYGVATTDDGSEDGLRPVSALYTSVIAVHDWEPGTTVGYGRYGRLTRPSRIATIPVGYADGIDRHLGRGAMSVWIAGHRCPTVGNICMDACMVDVTDLPSCRPGDRVEIFGPHVPASELADILGTIPYEILTSVSERVKRIYYRE